jgi:preprotein translocase subunit SecF
MELIKPGTRIPFLKYRFAALIVSAVLILVSVLSLVVKGGPNYGIDFSGGILIQVKFFEPVETAALRDSLLKYGYGQVLVQQFGSAADHEFLVRVEGTEADLEALRGKIAGVLSETFGPESLELRRTEMVGPKVGGELRKKGFLAVLYAMIGILIYITWRFEFRFAVGAILALLHDAVITVGVFSLLNKEIDLPIVAAILTIIGYSINDTIVVFDRVRENMRKIRRQGIEQVVNTSINETLSRTLITSLTTLLVVVALFLLGGPVIHNFAFALIIGIIVGTYSSIYVAAPLLIHWEEMRDRRGKTSAPVRVAAKE